MIGFKFQSTPRKTGAERLITHPRSRWTLTPYWAVARPAEDILTPGVIRRAKRETRSPKRIAEIVDPGIVENHEKGMFQPCRLGAPVRIASGREFYWRREIRLWSHLHAATRLGVAIDPHFVCVVERALGDEGEWWVRLDRAVFAYRVGKRTEAIVMGATVRRITDLDGSWITDLDGSFA